MLWSKLLSICDHKSVIELKPPPLSSSDASVEPKSEPKPEAKGKTTSDLTPQIATRAYELYEEQGRRDGQSVQDWETAEREVRKDDPDGPQK